MQMDANPLLDFSGLPRFAAIKPEHIAPAIDQLLANNRALIDGLTRAETPATWAGFAQPLEDANERLGRAWGVVGHLHAVLDSPELREAYKENQPKVVQYWTALGQNLRAVREVQGAPRRAGLRAAHARASEDRRERDPRLPALRCGVARGGETALRRDPGGIGEARDVSSRRTRSTRPTRSRCTSRTGRRSPGSPRTCSRPRAPRPRRTAGAAGSSSCTFRRTCRSCSTRRTGACARSCTAARSTRASEAFAAAFAAKAEFERRTDGKPAAASAGARRGRGVGQHAAHRAHSRPAPGGGAAPRLCDVRRSCRWCRRWRSTRSRCSTSSRTWRPRRAPYGERDWSELNAFAAAELGLERARGVGRRVRLRAAAAGALRVLRPGSEAVLPRAEGARRHVPAGRDAVRHSHRGGSRPRPGTPTVRFFRIADAGRRAVGRFYLDPYARATKRGGAWMDEAMTRRLTQHGLQRPVAYLVCNFSAPVGGKPALLTHDDVLTLFHEFGHGLHHLLTQASSTLGVSGIRGVEWDAVELPSQFMENFCWEWDVVRHMSAHVDTGEPLPRALFDKMLAAKNFQAGLQTLRQIEFALFDMHLHSDFDPAGANEPARAARRGARARSRWRYRRRTTASRTPSRTSSPAATARATTATSGPRCCRPTPTACSRRTACSTRRPARGSATRSSPSAAAARRSSRSARSAAANRRSRRCCATTGWPERRRRRA